MAHGKLALRFAVLAALVIHTAACSDVGDSSATPGDAASTDGTMSGNDSSPGTDSGGGGDDSSTPGNDTGTPGFDSSMPSGDTGVLDTGTPTTDGSGDDASDSGEGDSTVETGAPDSGAPETGTEDAPDDVAAEVGADTGVADTGTLDTGTPDTGTADTGTTAEAGEDGGLATLNAHCAANNGGAPCTPTELLLIEHDTNSDGTGKGHNMAYGCYDCMVMAGCIDDTKFSSDVDHECGDTGSMGIHQPTLGGGDATTSCLTLVSCILNNACTGDTGSGTCYCGTAAGTACTMPGSPNGKCLAEEQDGTDTTDPTKVNMRFTDISYAGGMANTLFSCAGSNTCTQCY
jgi:hypothetical protein